MYACGYNSICKGLYKRISVHAFSVIHVLHVHTCCPLAATYVRKYTGICMLVFVSKPCILCKLLMPVFGSVHACLQG